MTLPGLDPKQGSDGFSNSLQDVLQNNERRLRFLKSVILGGDDVKNCNNNWTFLCLISNSTTVNIPHIVAVFMVLNVHCSWVGVLPTY